MLWARFAGMTAALITIVLATPTQAQQPASPPFATTKVTDNVYIFRYGGHQSMFIVTPDGVIATDPISERRPAKPYIDAIEAVTKAPIKYVIYSHSHFDHIAGGKPFKDLGATFVAHRNARDRIAALNYADAQKEIKLPKYEAWPNYNAFLPMNIERYYDFWNRGI